jgi:hypothetical protein
MTHHTTQSMQATVDMTQEHSRLNGVHEGMAVYDAKQNRIGEVETVHFGAAGESTRAQATGPATVAPADTGYDQPLVDIFAAVFSPDELPDQLARKLYHTGFVRIDSAGLFAADRYVTPDQITRVEKNAVYLNVTRDELIKRT